ncbi:MAG TPA: ATP-binding protein [Puia sp.]|jgi:signal transduction histidine kinase/ActR/RegA family two-component response regulator
MRIVINARFALQRKIAWLLIFSFVSLSFIGWLIYFNKKDVESTTYWLNHTYAVITQIDKIKTRISAWDSVSGKPPNRSFYTALAKDLDRLEKLTEDNREQEQLVVRLSTNLNAATGNDSLSLVSLKDILREMMHREKELLSQRRLMTKTADKKVTVLLISGSILAFLLIFIILMRLNKDIVLRKEAEDKLRESQTWLVMQQQQLIAAIDEAQNAKGMQELFLANMSHEIRTPMNGIQGMTDLLLGTQLTPQQKEFAGVIKRSVNNLLVIVNDVLDFSKIKAGKLAIEKIEFRPKDVLDNITAMFAHRMNKKNVSWRVEIDPEIPEVLRGDPYRLNQVLINLVGNALKFTEQGQIRIDVTLRESSPRQVTLAFAVSDTGIGIGEDSLPHIFENFSQAGLDISRRYGGTGLGLAICQQLLKLQGGDITVQSIEGKGTTFNFQLPYEYDEEQQADLPVPTILADYSQCLAGKRFLVAEDNEVNQQLVDHVLKRGGGTVQLAGNGEEALHYLREGESYDLIIMDLQMPVMDGYEATRNIRQELGLPIPIIAMTATALVGEQLRCFEAGMNDYMTKPFEFTELYKRILMLLEGAAVCSGEQRPGAAALFNFKFAK